MRIIEAIFQSMFYERCDVISARHVKVHYDLSTKNYRANKQKAVAWAASFLTANPQAFEDAAKTAWEAKQKQDDLADSLLLVLYYLDTYSNQLTNGSHGFIQSGFIL